MSETLIFKHADLDALSELVADAVAKKLEPIVAQQQIKLLDRHQMAVAANISVPTLDRLVARRLVPSVLVGTRRLFEPNQVIAALTSRGRNNHVQP